MTQHSTVTNESAKDRRLSVGQSFEAVAEQTVLHVFRDLNVSASGRLLARTVVDETNTRIVVREDDLAAAIETLVEGGELTVEHDAEEDDWLLTLTEQGYARSRSLPRPGVSITKFWPSMKQQIRVASAKRTAARRHPG
ncbi:MAG: hypothetical protein CMP06_13270 [Xanthomonadales bacterium]|nr:hypothetical protein [Xanthomonadales bacterium]